MMSYSGPMLVTMIGLSMGIAMSFGVWHLFRRGHVLSATMRFIFGMMALGVLFSGLAVSGYLFRTTLFEPMNVESGRTMFMYLWLIPAFVTMLLALRRGLKGNRSDEDK